MYGSDPCVVDTGEGKMLFWNGLQGEEFGPKVPGNGIVYLGLSFPVSTGHAYFTVLRKVLCTYGSKIGLLYKSCI